MKIYGCKYHYGMIDHNYFCEIKKLCNLKKKLLPEIKYSKLQGKNAFLGTTNLL